MVLPLLLLLVLLLCCRFLHNLGEELGSSIPLEITKTSRVFGGREVS